MPEMAPAEGSAAPLLSLHGISKAFGTVQANDQIDLDLYPSEVLALLGENGAGKSTLVKILYGFYQADSGSITFRGRPVSIQSPNDARVLEIGMVFQAFNLIPAFTVAENIALFYSELGPLLNLSQIATLIERLGERFKLKMDPAALVMDLAVGDQQKVEILKLLISGARILILDEPTRVLAPHETQLLFEVLGRLRVEGYSVILITHKLDEVMQIADRVAVLRKGRLAGTLPIDQASETGLVQLMFERQLAEFQSVYHGPAEVTPKPLLELRGISTRGEGLQVSLRDLDLRVHAGEIVGITGVSGNGQRELADVMLGRLKPFQGIIELAGERVNGLSIREIRRRGVAFIPESPMAMAVAPYLTVLENMAIPELGRYARGGGMRIDWEAAQLDAAASAERLGYSFPLFALARSLSGGNLQRMVIARELAHQPRLIIASYLTSGLDVHSAISARSALRQARDQGSGVVLFSDDLEELFALSDRLVVLQGGRIRGRFKPSETSFEQVGYLMTGSGPDHGQRN